MGNSFLFPPFIGFSSRTAGRTWRNVKASSCQWSLRKRSSKASLVQYLAQQTRIRDDGGGLLGDFPFFGNRDQRTFLWEGLPSRFTFVTRWELRQSFSGRRRAARQASPTQTSSAPVVHRESWISLGGKQLDLP